jgi:signal transduction histidine kinase
MMGYDFSPGGSGEVSMGSVGGHRGSVLELGPPTPLGFAGPAGALEDRMHALRSGLAAVAGGIQVLTEHRADLSGRQRDRLEAMLTMEITRLQRLVEVPETHAAPVAPEELELDELIGDVVLARAVAGQDVHWEPTGHRVVGRRDELVEVLTILLVNAYRHADGSPARVEVSSSDGMVRVSVTDDGPGIPRELRDAIFERGARRTASPGQGLGLSIARELVTDLGGTLALEGGERGARFDVRLRAVEMGGAA